MRSNHLLGAAAGGIFAYVILASGVLFPRHHGGGITQIGRHISVAYDDGSVLEMSESETDLAVWKRRRFAGNVGHDFQQIFIMADGREMEVPWNLSKPGGDSEELSTGDVLLQTADAVDVKDEVPLNQRRKSGEVLNLRLDGSYQLAYSLADADNPSYIDMVGMIDGKDRVIAPDPKDGPAQAPVTARSTEPDPQSLFASDSSYLGGMGSLGGANALVSGPGSLAQGGTPGVSAPPIGAAVPEPSTVALVGLAGVVGWALAAHRRHGIVR